MAESKWSKNVVTELKGPVAIMGERAAEYAKWATRILWIDDNVVPGSFQLGISWYNRPPDNQMSGGHKHDTDEILAFFGSDPANPHELNGEIEFWIEDEQFILTKSALIFVPAGVQHCPLIIRRVDKPILHFTTVTAGRYEQIRD
jgi:mannose-6-phosphate isomerase-like protein (cupin superfamily)